MLARSLGTVMSPSTGASVCFPLPSSGSRLSGSPPSSVLWGRKTPRRPSRPSLVSLDGAVPLRGMPRLLPRPAHPCQPGPGPLGVRRCQLPVSSGGGGRPPRFLGNPCERVPRARDSGGSQRPRRHGRPDAVFRQANGVDIRNGKRFRSWTLAARVLAAYASHPPVARREARLATGLPAPALAGLESHQLDSLERFRSAHVTSSSPRLGLAR